MPLLPALLLQSSIVLDAPVENANLDQYVAKLALHSASALVGAKHPSVAAKDSAFWAAAIQALLAKSFPMPT